MSAYNKQGTMKYINECYGSWRVQKTINGKQVLFGYFKDLDEAIAYRDKCVRNNWDTSLIKHKNKEYKYISKFRNKYRVQKRLNDKTVYFGSFDYLEEAQCHRDKCIEGGWSTDCISRVYDYNQRYVYKDGKSYVIRKIINGVFTHFGTFKSLDEAINERDLLIKCDWDYNLLCEEV